MKATISGSSSTTRIFETEACTRDIPPESYAKSDYMQLRFSEVKDEAGRDFASVYCASCGEHCCVGVAGFTGQAKGRIAAYEPSGIQADADPASELCFKTSSIVQCDFVCGIQIRNITAKRVAGDCLRTTRRAENCPSCSHAKKWANPVRFIVVQVIQRIESNLVKLH